MNSDDYDVGYKIKSNLDNETYKIFISSYGNKYWEEVHFSFWILKNSIFYGEELLTTKKSTITHDQSLLKKLKIRTL